MDEYCIARMMLMTQVRGGRVRGRPRLGWIDGGLGQQRDDGGGCATMKREGVESTGTVVHTKMIEFHVAFLLGSCILSDHPLSVWWLITWGGLGGGWGKL